MTQRSLVGLSVSDLDASVRFYRDILGFPVETRDAAGTAVVTIHGREYLLAAPEAGRLMDLLDLAGVVLNTRDALYVAVPDLDARRARITAASIETRDLERPWGDYGFEVRDPDGYRVEFWGVIERTCRETLDLYRQGRDALRAAIADLSSAELDLRDANEGWSIREVVHHVAESEVTVLAAIRAALAEPGKEFLSNPYDQRLWAESLAYTRRDVGPSLRLYEAIRDQVMQMLEIVPGAWERSVWTNRGGATTVHAYVLMLAIHGLEHIEQIRQIRAAHGIARP